MFFKKTSSYKRDEEFERAVAEFVGRSETVFHHDWEYAKDMIGKKERLYLLSLVSRDPI